MSLLRSVRVYGRRPEFGPYALLVEHTQQAGAFLSLQGGAILPVNAQTANQWKGTSTRLTDAYGLLGILRVAEGLFLIITASKMNFFCGFWSNFPF
jgi:hypothetical protein